MAKGKVEDKKRNGTELERLRYDCERGGEPILEVPFFKDGFKKLYVIVRIGPGPTSDNPHYWLHRYFTVFGKWQVSHDVRGVESLARCVEVMNEDEDFRSLSAEIHKD